jgi:hypothetical protein
LTTFLARTPSNSSCLSSLFRLSSSSVADTARHSNGCVQQSFSTVLRVVYPLILLRSASVADTARHSDGCLQQFYSTVIWVMSPSSISAPPLLPTLRDMAMFVYNNVTAHSFGLCPPSSISSPPLLPTVRDMAKDIYSRTVIPGLAPSQVPAPLLLPKMGGLGEGCGVSGPAEGNEREKQTERERERGEERERGSTRY